MLYNHLLGLYEKALPSDMPWQERFELAKSVGVDFIELSVDETDEKLARLRWNRAERRQLWEMAWDAGMPFKSMCLSGHRRFPFGSIDERARQNAHDMMVRAIDLACDLGLSLIHIYFGYSSAMAVVLTLCLLVVAIPYVRGMLKEEK